jgi:Co/Zn/Cd efflux system component
MQSVPDEDLYNELKEHIESIEGVKLIDNFKLWSLDGEEQIATITLSVLVNADVQNIRLKAKSILNKHNIYQTTVEVIA